MVKMINKVSGGIMYVHESRVEEYKAAGHKLAADSTPEKPIMNKPVSEEAKNEPEEEPVKKTTAKRRKR